MTGVLLVYYEPRPAGQTTHVVSLARGLQRAGYRVTVVVPVHLETSAAALRETGASVIELPMTKLLWRPATGLALSKLIRSRRFALVHVHSQEAGVPARLIATLAGAPHILYTPQNIDIRRARWQPLYARGERCLAHLTERIISVNEFDRQRLIGWGIPAGKVVSIPNGIDLAAFAGPVDVAGVRRALGLAEAGPLVMQMGRLSAQKAPLAFVEGAARVLRECPGAQFALVGEGPLRDALVARIRELGLEAQVHLLGWRADAARLLAAADVVTLTSLWEGTPYALLEAMAWSRPVVATAVNGCGEVVEEGRTGFLAPPRQMDEWAARVLQLLRDPEAASAMGQRGRERVETHFSIEQMMARIERLYGQVLGEAPGQSPRES